MLGAQFRATDLWLLAGAGQTGSTTESPHSALNSPAVEASKLERWQTSWTRRFWPRVWWEISGLPWLWEPQLRIEVRPGPGRGRGLDLTARPPHLIWRDAQLSSALSADVVVMLSPLTSPQHHYNTTTLFISGELAEAVLRLEVIPAGHHYRLGSPLRPDLLTLIHVVNWQLLYRAGKKYNNRDI